jgi:primosomal protein N''
MKSAWLAILLLTPLPALAQTVTQTPLSTLPETAAPSDLPVAAMRHEQPKEADVHEREVERFGPAEVQHEQTAEQAEVDQIYQEVMRRSAPPSGAPLPQ